MQSVTSTTGAGGVHRNAQARDRSGGRSGYIEEEPRLRNRGQPAALEESNESVVDMRCESIPREVHRPSLRVESLPRG